MLNEDMREYRKQLSKGTIQRAYQGIMDYTSSLRNYLKNKYPNHYVGNIYNGYMDMTYFSFTTDVLRKKKLKIAIVFIHEICEFEVWLAGTNKQVQIDYWKLFKENEWKKYKMPSSVKGVDSITEYVVVENPDFSDLERLTKKIEKRTLEFIEAIEDFLSCIEED